MDNKHKVKSGKKKKKRNFVSSDRVEKEEKRKTFNLLFLQNLLSFVCPFVVVAVVIVTIFNKLMPFCN